MAEPTGAIPMQPTPIPIFKGEGYDFWELTIPHTPEHNGVVERKNRTVMGLTRSMLKQKGMPNNFWAKGVATAVYLLNRAPTKARPNKTPIEEWGGTKPSVHHLRVFGCIAYSLTHPQGRQKLDNRSEKCLFVGYSPTSYGYRLYNPITKSFVVQKHVVFHEDGVWQWNIEGRKEQGHEAVQFGDPFPTDVVGTDGDPPSPNPGPETSNQINNSPREPNSLSQTSRDDDTIDEI
ncbi:hypothetical protein E3N88_19614 [Mikania micrantha]|uniref:Integrase catalytic domain-containing protein n=1 Tax=Mikania micrantha TaxID=192012 RepID=A0A5N6NRG7_9ASTR|nr:hypothetical protein E3N88_19614 [Mikania micrantha]